MTANDSNAHRKHKVRFEANLPPDEEKLMERAKRIMGEDTDRGLLMALVRYYIEGR